MPAAMAKHGTVADAARGADAGKVVPLLRADGRTDRNVFEGAHRAVGTLAIFDGVALPRGGELPEHVPVPLVREGAAAFLDGERGRPCGIVGR